MTVASINKGLNLEQHKKTTISEESQQGNFSTRILEAMFPGSSPLGGRITAPLADGNGAISAKAAAIAYAKTVPLTRWF